MGSKIEWTDETWNPIVGCTRVSEGCRNCYAYELHDKRHRAFAEGKKLPTGCIKDALCPQHCGHKKGKGLDLVIVGGESGPHARPIHPDWVRGLRDLCKDTGVSFFFKQWGEWFVPEDGSESCRVCGCTEHNACDGGCYWVEPGLCSECVGKSVPVYRPVKYRRIGKGKAGRILDGRTWDEFPDSLEGGNRHA